MPTANEKLRDEAVSHAHDVQRYTNGAVYRVLAMLNKADGAIEAQLILALAGMDANSFTVQRLQFQLASVKAAHAQVYTDAFGQIEKEMRALADYEALYQSTALQAVIPLDARPFIQFFRVTPEAAYAAAIARPFQGGLLRDWATSAEANRMGAIRDAIRVGFVQGQSVDQIVRGIRGTRARQYKDGLLERSRRSVTAMVRTALSHTASTAREEVYKANADIISAIAWLSTLDGKTSEPCRVRDGLRYTADPSHKPIGHSVPWLQGPGRLHWQCRSLSTPVLKSWRELGIDADGISDQTRASMDGKVPAETTYSEWLARQSAARQEDILGPTRARLIRQGGLSPNQLYSARGDYLTLAQLAKRDSSAFARAGLD